MIEVAIKIDWRLSIYEISRAPAADDHRRMTNIGHCRQRFEEER